MSQRDLREGCLVRFLNAVGGGRVSRITKDTAWVEDPDGFEMPTPLSECVVVDDGDTFVPAYKPPTLKRSQEAKPDVATTEPAKAVAQELKQAIAQELRGRATERSSGAEPVSQEPKVREPHTFVPASGEVDVVLAILPVDELRIGHTPYEVYLVNDSKYTLYYVYSLRVGAHWELRGHGLLLPEKDLLLEEVAPSELSPLEHINVQLMAIAENPGIYKGTYSTELRLDTRRLLRLNSFVDNDYFADRALVVDVVRAGVVAGSTPSITSGDVREALQSSGSSAPNPTGRPQASRPATSSRPEEPLVTDLHLEHWLDDTSGMSPLDMLRYQMGKFNEVMQRYASKTGSRLIFIHGKGGGVLRTEIMRELSRRYPHCHSQDASFVEYGHGATLVIVGNTKASKKRSY